MPDWTTPYKPEDPPPGPVNPPPPDQIQPTDPGWSEFVRKETDKTGLKWTPACSVSLEVAATGASMTWPIDGDNPTDFEADKDWGWKEDRTYETVPPDPYQDFTRWVRHYPKMRTQRYVQYKATVYVRCGAHFVNARPSYFWVPDGQETTGPVDIYLWTITSGLKTDEHGKTYKWTTTGKKTPPVNQAARPDASWLRPYETPPDWLIHPIDLGPYKFHWKLRYDWLAPYSTPVEPGTKHPNWFRIGDLFDAQKEKPKKGE
jgi:hypothetical protein